MRSSMVALAAVAALGTASGAGLSSVSSYVQQGLVTHFDAIDNEGTGAHNASTTVWRDLKNNAASLTLRERASWGDTFLNCGTNYQTIVGATSVNSFCATVESAVNLDCIGRGSATKTVWPFLVSSGALSFHGAGDSSRTFRFFVNGADPRPDASGIYTNTLSGTSDGSKYRIYRDGEFKAAVNSVGSGRENGSTWTLSNGNGGIVNAKFYSFRVYNRALSDAELAWNAVVDKVRFHSLHLVGDGSAVNWGEAAWLDERYAPASAPSTGTNAIVVVDNTLLNVAATDNPALALLSLENGATLNLAADAVLSLKELYVEGEKVPRGIYTADDADWIAGAGEVRVAGAADRAIPFMALPEPSEDGYYEFGDDDGEVAQAVGYKTSGTSYHYMKGEWPHWEDYAFPVGAKLRLKGYVLLDTVPSNTFSTVDFSKLKYLMLHSPAAFADGTRLVIPSGAKFRYQPGTWTPYTNLLWVTSAPDISKAANYTCTADIHFDGGTLTVYGDGVSFAYPVFSGSITGTGTYHSTNFGKQSRFIGGFAFDCSTSGFQNGQLMWFDTHTITARMETVTFPNCDGTFAMNSSWCGAGFIFGRDNNGTPADHELYIKTLNGGALSKTDGNGRRWRTGGHLFVWGSNTVHVGTMSGGIHAVTRYGEIDLSQGHFSSARVGVGPAFLVVDRLASGNLYLSTNFYCKVGTVSTSSQFDYTYQSGNVNRTTLDITNSCASSAVVKATDLAMLPARVSGFAGSVQLTDPSERSYTIPVDLSQGEEGLYQTVGCIGSGTLTAAPATGTINATFPADVTPVKGEYALARFTAGGDLLAGWTVTLNGGSERSVSVNGMDVTVVKDATGIYLKVSKSGVAVILR